MTIQSARKIGLTLVPVLVCFLLGILTTAAFLCAIQMNNALVGFHPSCFLTSCNINSMVLAGITSFYWAICVGVLTIWYFHRWKDFAKINCHALSLSSILSLFLIIGYSQETTNKLFLFFNQSPLVEVFLYIGVVALIYTIMVRLFRRFDQIPCHCALPTEEKAQKWHYCYATAIILLGWLPFVIAFYPGSIGGYDTFVQLAQAAGQRNLDASNPVLVTWLFGAFLSAGRNLANDNIGIFMGILFQTLLWLVASVRSCIFIKRLSRSNAAYWLSVAFFAAIPMWGAFIQCLIKDSVHTGFFLLFLLSYIHHAIKNDLVQKDYVALFLLAVLTGLTRKAAPVIVVVSLLALTIFNWRDRNIRKNLIATSVSIIGVFVMVSFIIRCMPNIAVPAERENYSLPFQQVARYCVEHGAELSEEDIATINQVLDYKTIARRYTPDKSDDVKRTFHGSFNNMAAFWKLYIRLGLKHPSVYIKHLLAGTYKYNYPLSLGDQPYRQYIHKDDTLYHVTYGNNRDVRESMRLYFEQWQNGLLSSIFIGPGLYVWALLILVFYAMCKKRRRSLLAITPVILLYLGLYLSHVNGENRYALPLMVAIPVCASVVLHFSRTGEKV